MRKNHSYKPQQKAQAVLQVLNGTKSAAQVCRDLNINENLLSRWKQQLLTHAALVFERESEAAEKDEQIAELQRLVGRLTMELEVAKKASQLASYQTSKNGK
jgi:transposase-like protein